MTGVKQLKIELTSLVPSGAAPRADGRGEAHIRVLTNKPVGPEIWETVSRRLSDNYPWFFGTYEGTFEKFFTELTELEEGEDSYGGFGHEQWFLLAEKREAYKT